MKYLKLVRYQNLLLIAFMLLIFHYGFLKLQDIYVALYDWKYIVFVLATVLIAAGGYVINDIMDQDTDSVNKPEKQIVGKLISENTAYNLYFGLTISGVLLGYYISSAVFKTSFFAVFFMYAALLYMYATSLKQIPVLGNIVVAFVLGLSVMSVGIFDISPMMTLENQSEMMLFLMIILDYAIFAFFINLIREIIKDIEDIEGDKSQDINTLAVVFGVEKTKIIVFGLGIISCGVLLWYIYDNLMSSKLYYATIYCLLLVVAPMIFFIIKTWNASSKKDFHFLSNLLKVVIFFGILSILIITLNIQSNA